MSWATSSGELRLNWQRKDIGRITRVSGETTARGLSQAHALLDKLHRAGQLELLCAVRDGQLSMRQLRQYERDKVLDLRAPDLLERLSVSQPLWQTIVTVLPRMGKAESTRGLYAQLFRKLAEQVTELQDAATLGHLARVSWPEVQRRWPGGPGQWNLLRAAVGRMLTLALDDVNHPLRRRVMRGFPMLPRRAHGSSLTVAQLGEILTTLPAIYRPAILTLAVTGMRVGELYALTPACVTDTGAVLLVAIPSVTDEARKAGRVAHRDARTKTGGRVLVVDRAYAALLGQALCPPFMLGTLSANFAKAGARVGVKTSVHALRHLHGQELADRGSLSLARQSLGHTNIQTTLVYSTRSDMTRVSEVIAPVFRHLLDTL